MSAVRPILHYATDPLCGWCFGFAPVIGTLSALYEGRIEVRPIMGGLAVGDRAVPVAEGFGYIKGALPDVERATGVRFGAGFHRLLDAGTYVYDSLPPCRAMVAFQQHIAEPARQLAYLERLHEALFVEGRDLNDPLVLADLAHPAMTAEAFVRAYTDPSNLPATVAAFERAQALGARGFPSLVLQVGEQTQVVTRGYRPKSELEPLFAAIAERFGPAQAS